SVTASLVLYGADGNTIASLTGLGLRAMPTARRKPLRARFWRQVIEQRSGAEPLVALPKDWAEPAARLKKLGLLARRQKSAGAGGLLIDAAARRLSWDVVANLAGPTRRLDATVLNGIDATAYPLFGRMLLALEEDALFAREVEDDAPPMTGTLAEGCDYPEFDELLRGLWDEAPELSGDLNALAGLADVLQDRLQDGLLESNALPRVQDRLQRRLQHGRWKVFETAFADLAESWSSGQRLTVLLIGVPPRDLLERILDHANLTRLTLTDPDDGLVELMDRDLQRHPALDVVPWEALVAGGHERDLVMVADRFSGMTTAGLAGLSRLLDAGGLMLGLHSSPSLAGDLIDGQQAGWWAATGDVSSNAPVGRRVAGPELAAALTQAGFSDVNISAADLSDPEVLVVSGIGSRSQKSARPAVSGSEETSPARTIFHRQSKGPSNASALGAALGTLEPEAEEPQLLALAPLISVPPVPWEGIVLLHPSSSEEAGSAATEIAEGIGEIQGLLDRLPAPDRLWIVIPGGCPGTAANTGQSASMAGLWGYGRTLINEYPDLEIRLVDPGLAPTDQPGRDDWAMRLAEIIASPGDEREILVNPTGLAVPRIEPVCSMEEPVGLGLPDTTLKLVAARVGGLDDLNWEPASRRPPEEGEVEIAIHATGLNFRDVMWAQGLLPEEALQHGFAGPALGMECAGVVVRAGQGSGFSEGERVAAFASGAFASHVTTPATTVMRIPEHLTFEAAASLPVVFATAHYALAELARVGPGDRVLLHGGAGGVGLAALQIARSKGARVFATAGTPAKRRILVAFGAEAVFDSRNLSFADQVLAASDGGVDVVLNALAGEAMERTIGCLRPFGRFIELGKRDFFADTKIGLYPFHRNLSYFGVDLDELLAARPHEAGRLIDAFSTAMEAGQVKPLPHQTFQAGDATLAFRLMQQAGHVGKIVIKPPRASGQAPHIQDFSTTTNVRGGWLVVGGTQGFGLATAKALAARGAEKLWLASRSGRPDEAGANEIAGLISQGISVEFLAMDVADADAVDAAFAGIAEDRVPLRGVVHSAMVLRDRPARELSEDDVMAVLAPKVAGAENLDRATRGQALDHFILYSSAVTLFGNLHQAPYVAANMALERIAAARRADGEVALAIGWGAIGDSGYLTRDQAARGLLDRLLDGAFISEEEALVGLSRWQRQDAGVDPDEAAVSFARLPWTRLAGDLPILSTPLFDRLDEPHAVETGVGDAAALRAELASLPPREALKMITAVLVTETATVLHQPEDEVDPRRPLGEIGFDSLMAVELRLGLEDKIGVSLPMLSLADATTLTDVAVKVLQTIRNGGLESEHEEGSALDELVSQHAAPGEGLETDEKADLRARAKNVKSLS
ncbi:MAG: SDR family NAD(P)-dependent oxidoreductase, partial [Pseudomonadota bacterium]